MNEDVTLDRGELSWLVGAATAYVGPDFETTKKLMVMEKVSAREAPQFGLRTESSDLVPQLRDKLTRTAHTAHRLVGVLVQLADRLATELTAAGKDQECSELLAHVSGMMQGVAGAMGEVVPPGSFATPPGSVGVWAVWDNQAREDSEYRLFLDRGVAQAYADERAYCDPEPQIVWARNPERISLWTVKVLVDAHGERLASSHQSDRRWYDDPDQFPLALVNPQVEATRAAGGWWDVTGIGPDLDAVQAAVSAAADAKSAEIRGGLLAQGINPDRAPRDTDYGAPIV